jgi:hypothetical protein
MPALTRRFRCPRRMLADRSSAPRLSSLPVCPITATCTPRRDQAAFVASEELAVFIGMEAALRRPDSIPLETS